MGEDSHVPPLSQRVPGAANWPTGRAARQRPPVLPKILLERVRATLDKERAGDAAQEQSASSEPTSPDASASPAQLVRGAPDEHKPSAQPLAASFLGTLSNPDAPTEPFPAIMNDASGDTSRPPAGEVGMPPDHAERKDSGRRGPIPRGIRSHPVEQPDPVERAASVEEWANSVANFRVDRADPVDRAASVEEWANSVANSLVDNPVVDRAEPAVSWTEPVVDQAGPLAEQVEPVAEQAEPVAEPVDPVAESAEPVEPVSEQAERVEQAEQVAEPVEPVAESAEPVEPVSEQAEPVEPVAEQAEPVLDKPSKRRSRQLAVIVSVVVIISAGSLAFAVSRHSSTSAAHGGSGASSDVPQKPAATRNLAATWVAGQVSAAALVLCDPVMCRALGADKVPAGRLRVLRPATADLGGADVVVATPAVRGQYGARLSSVYAPAVIASFGSGDGRIDIRVTAAHGAAAYRSALRADLLARMASGDQLLRSKRIVVSAAAGRLLVAGRVDSRLLITIASLAALHPVYIVAFGDPSPGAPSSPLRSADLAQVDASGTASSASAQTMLALLDTQHPPYLIAHVKLMRVADGQTGVRVEFAAPSPLGLLGPNTP
jgi:hypothetical protein